MIRFINVAIGWLILSALCSANDPVVQCFDGRCDVVHKAAAVVATPIVMASNVVEATTERMSDAYQTALASAQYRAANRIHGHSYIDSQTTSGVGWASHDSMPTTCLGRGGENYAVVRGSDGWYATKIASRVASQVKPAMTRFRVLKRR